MESSIQSRECYAKGDFGVDIKELIETNQILKASLKTEKIFEKLNVPILFGLEAQGHIGTIEKMLAEGKNWDEIGNAIGWHGPTAEKYYINYTKKKAVLE